MIRSECSDGKEKKKAEKIKNLETTYVKIQRQRDMAHSDFPDAEEFKKNLSIFPWEVRVSTRYVLIK